MKRLEEKLLPLTTTMTIPNTIKYVHRDDMSYIAFLDITNGISYYRISCYRISAAIRQLVLLELVPIVHVILAFQLGTELSYITDQE